MTAEPIQCYHIRGVIYIMLSTLIFLVKDKIKLFLLCYSFNMPLNK